MAEDFAKMDKHSDEYYEWVEKHLRAALLADVMDTIGHWDHCMCHEIRPLDKDTVMAGRAATLLTTDVFEIPKEPYLLELQLIDVLKPGEILTFACHGLKTSAMWGELLATSARTRGARGAVMDGAARDTIQLMKMRFPTFCAGFIPGDSKGRTSIVDVRVPVKVGGIKVENGDLIVGDNDGVVVVPQQIESEVISLAYKKYSGENTVRELLAEGKSLKKVFDKYGIL